MKQRKEKKKKRKVWSYRRIARLKRDDGLRMKTVTAYTMNEVVECAASRNGKRLALAVYGDEESGITYSRLRSMKDGIGIYLIEHGFAPGNRIAIMGESCPTWLVAYFGITSVGCVAVPILPDFSAREALAILEKSGARGIVVNGRHFAKVLPFVNEYPSFLVRMEDLFHIPEPISSQLTDGRQFQSAPGRDIARRRNRRDDAALLEARRPKEEDLASLIFTSGTTGTSKGVMLSHRNLVWNADISSDVYVKIKAGDRALSILPVSHVYEFTTGQILPLMRGAEIHYLGRPPAPSILLPALREVRPAIMLSVPLLIEKVYRSSVLPVLRDNEKVKFWLRFPPTRHFVTGIIGRKLKITFGGKLKFFGIGGAPLDSEVERFLYEARFPYALGYGLTETSPLIAGCGPRNHRPGVTGRIVENLDVRIEDKDPDTGVGEITVKGPSVMLGYFDNPELNGKSFTSDGYFRTGDLGVVDRRGRLAIRGRSKTMILGSGGENIYPESIESVINNQDFVTESLVVPEDGGLLALVKIDIDSYAKNMALNVGDVRQDVLKYLAKIREDVNKELSSFSRISSVKLQEEPFQRTPTKKIKRFLYTKLGKRDGEDSHKG